MVAALPILKSGCCWRVRNGPSIKVQKDKWIPNYPINKLLHLTYEESEKWLVFELIDLELHCWRCDIIMTSFNREDTKAIYKIHLSHKQVLDSVVWLHNRKGVYSVKPGYHVAKKVMQKEDWAECLRGSGDLQVWKNLWKLRVPNKIKVFGWSACHEIFPTRVNLARRRVISYHVCHCCKSIPESTVHAIWECSAAQDVWAGSSINLQKCSTNQCDIVQLFQFLFDRLTDADFEFFLVQAWLIWNQRIKVVHGG